MRHSLMLPTLAALVISLSAVPASYASPSRFNPGTTLNSGECYAEGSPVINVVQNVINSVDSGQGGNYWAFDDYRRQIKVWEQDDGTYCAIVHYEGKFDGQAGQTSPGATGVLSGKEDSSFSGGYRATIDGTLKGSPDWKIRGNVGTSDYQCDISGSCPGSENWIEIDISSRVTTLHSNGGDGSIMANATHGSTQQTGILATYSVINP